MPGAAVRRSAHCVTAIAAVRCHFDHTALRDLGLPHGCRYVLAFGGTSPSRPHRAHRAGYVHVHVPGVGVLLSAMFEGLHLTIRIGAGVALALGQSLILAPGRS